MKNRIRFTLLIAYFFVAIGGMLRAQSPIINPLMPDSIFATGETMNINGINLKVGTGVDDILMFTKLPGLTVTDTFDFNSGLISGTPTALTFIVPPVLECGEYRMVLRTDTGNVTNFSSNSIDVFIKDSIQVIYPMDTFCVGDTSPIPFINPNLDTPNFTIQSTNASSPFVDFQTGEFWVQQSGIGRTIVNASLPATGGCGAQQLIPLVIRPFVTNATLLDYSSAPFCALDTPVVMPINVTPAPGGGSTFSTIPGVVWDSVEVGWIDAVQTPPGNYTVIYSPRHNLCLDNDTTVINLLAVDSAVFDYSAQYCEGDTSPIPLITSRPPGYFMDTVTVDSFVYDTATGAVNLGASDPGTYTMFYVPFSGTCADTSQDVFTIIDTQEASFIYNPNTVCLNDSFIIPDSILPGLPGGYFRDTSGTVNLDINTGVVTVTGSPTGGPHYIFYVNGDPTCPDSSASPFYIVPQDSFAVSYPKTSYCFDDPDPLPVFTSGTTGGTFISRPPMLNPMALNDSTGEIDLSGAGVGTAYEIIYVSPNAGCGDTVVVDTVTVFGAADASFTMPNGLSTDTLCQSTGLYGLNVTNPTAPGGYIAYGANGVINNAVVAGDSLDTGVLTRGGPYPIIRWAANGACRDTATSYYILDTTENAGINYVISQFCQGSSNPVPLLLGVPGGTFDTVSPGNGLVVDPQTGLVDLSSGLGTFYISYTTNGSCPGMGLDTIEILPATPVIDYFNGPNVCDTTPLIYVDTTLAGFVRMGTFSYDTAAAGTDTLIMDPLTGTINTDSTPSGTYIINYDLGNNASCSATATYTINIIAGDDTTYMYYPDSLFCPSDTNPSPIIYGNTGGFFLTTPGVNFLDSLGTISLANSLPNPNGYIISYDLNQLCSDIRTDTIFISDFESAYFEYFTDRFCNTDSNPVPSFIQNPGGIFSARDDLGAPSPFVDSLTGEFFVDSIQQNNVQYVVTYIPSSSCSDTFDLPITIFRGPINAALIPDVLQDACEGSEVELIASGSDNGYLWIVNGTPTFVGGPYLENEYTLRSNDLPDNTDIVVVFENAAGCQDTLSRFLNVRPRPVITIPETEITISGEENVEIGVYSFLDGTFMNWVANSTSDVIFSNQSDLVGPVANGDSIVIRNQMSLVDNSSPAEVIVSVTPIADSCSGASIPVFIKVNPNNEAIFIPGVITPDGNDLNDKWLIQWRNDIVPSDYTILLYNRAGGLVRTLNGLSQDFTGESLPDGVYWYKVLDRTGQTFRSGGLTIRRK